MKKIDVSLIKRFMRINRQASSFQCEPFVNSVLDLSHYSFSIVPLETQSFLGALLVGVAYFDSWIKKTKEEQERARRYRHQQLHQIFLQVPSCTYDFCTILTWMTHACGFLFVICHWHIGLPGSIMDCLALPFSGYPW